MSEHTDEYDYDYDWFDIDYKNLMDDPESNETKCYLEIKTFLKTAVENGLNTNFHFNAASDVHDTLFKFWMNKQKPISIYTFDDSTLHVELEIFTDKKMYTNNVRSDLITHISNYLQNTENDINYILLGSPADNKNGDSHSSVLIYEKTHCEIKHFDSNGYTYYNVFNKIHTYGNLVKKFVSNITTSINAEYNSSVSRRYHKLNSGDGFCLLWSYFIIYMTAMYSMPVDDIVRVAGAYTPKRVNLIIKGFYFKMMREVRELLPAEIFDKIHCKTNTNLPLVLPTSDVKLDTCIELLQPLVNT